MKFSIHRRYKVESIIAVLLFFGFEALAQKNEIYLIVRADDMGSTHSANLACIEAVKNGIATSVELMVPCPWFEEAVTLLNENPSIDVGIHLTLTSEWLNYKWKPLTSCRSITDESGNFYPGVWEDNDYPGQSLKESHNGVMDIEKELRAQIELAIDRIPHISHMTEHMGCLGFSEETKQLGEKLSEHYNLPLYFDDYNLLNAPGWSSGDSSGEKVENLIEMIGEIDPGIWLTVEHPAYNYPEMQVIDRTGKVGKERQEVLDAFTCKKVKMKIEDSNVKLISYRELIRKRSKKGDIKSNPSQDIKNVVVILADDHALKVTGCYGNEIVKTPSIDKLSRSGITFTKAYCNSPICSASRQSLLTGKYPHTTGVNLLFTPFPDETNPTVAEHLVEYGYKTAIIGKEHWNNAFWTMLYKEGLPNHGFEQRIGKKQYSAFLEENPMPEIPLSLETYEKKQNHESVAEWMNYRCLPQPVNDEYSEGTFYAKAAEKFFKECKDEPFFLWLAFKEPHHPYYFPIEYKDKYNPDDMPLPEGSPEDDRWVPAKFKNLTDDERRGIIASYYTSTEYLDKNIGLVMEALKSNNLDENTLVVYISDNGYLLNDHKRFEKHTMWEEAVQQPMIFRVPGIEGNVTNSSLIEYIDVVPTILDFIGKPELNEVQGKSFEPLIKGERTVHREYVFSEYLQDNMAMVATREWKYIFHTGSRDLGIGYFTGNGPSGIFHGLYNLKLDKSEGSNLAYYPEHKSVLDNMQEMMLLHFIETHPDAENCPQNLTTEGKLVWFCEPRDVGAIQNVKDVPDVIFEAR